MGRHHSQVLNIPEIGNTKIGDSSHDNPIQLAMVGDRQAFDTIRHEHDKELRSFISRRVRPDEVDDLLQDIWLSVWTSLKTYSGRCRFKTWLYSIAIFKVRDLYRRNLRDQNWTSHIDIESLTVPIDLFESQVQKHWVKAALESLTPDQRQLLELYYFSEFTLAEIATILNKPPNPVKYQFYRAHRDVADYMMKSNAPSQVKSGDQGK